MLPFICACVFVDPPVALSPPHFYQGNKSLVEAVHGLNPQKSLHETFADIEPVRRNLKPLGYVACSGARFVRAKGGLRGHAPRAHVFSSRALYRLTKKPNRRLPTRATQGRNLCKFKCYTTHFPRYNVIKLDVYVVVQFHLFQTHYHTLPFPEIKGNTNFFKSKDKTKPQDSVFVVIISR